MLNNIYNIFRDIPKLNYMAHKIIYFLEGTTIFNFYYYKYIRDKAAKISNLPEQIAFSMTYLCNADCIMCPIKKYRELNNEEIKFLSDEIFEKVILETKSTVKDIIFSGGEPLLDKKLFKRVEFEKKNNPRTYLKFFTNGSLLHKNDFIRKIIESPLDDITVSLDATTKEEYEEVRKNLSFAQVINNIKELYELKQKVSPNKILRLSVLALKANEESHRDFFVKMRGHADILEITNPHNFAGFVDVDTKNAYTVKRKYPCYYLWSRMTVLPDGRVSICGSDFLRENIVGNVNDMSVKEIWMSKTFEKARELHLKGAYAQFNICNNCTTHTFWWKKLGD